MMAGQIEIGSELVRLAQWRVRKAGLSLAGEMARMIAEQAVSELDPERGRLVEPDCAWSAGDELAALGASDIVVNGIHVDVRPLDDQEMVTAPRSLVGTSWLANGTLVVAMSGHCRGRVAGYVTPEAWVGADRQAGEASEVGVSVRPSADFDLEQALSTIEQRPQRPPGKERRRAPETVELAMFVQSPAQLTLARRRQIVEALVADQDARRRLAEVISLWSDGTLARVLSAGAVWMSRVDALADQVSGRYQRLDRDQVKRQIMRTGEKFGGQPESPEFRRALGSSLAREEILARFKGLDPARLGEVVDSVVSGRPVMDAVGQMVKNRAVLDLAAAIKSRRRHLEDFVAATADEIASAFRRLALKPAYATHGADGETGVEAVNEALALLEAAELAAELKNEEFEAPDRLS